jgi:hypothetical protein
MLILNYPYKKPKNDQLERPIEYHPLITDGCYFIEGTHLSTN